MSVPGDEERHTLANNSTITVGDFRHKKIE